MTRLLVILIAILLAWMWIARMIRAALRGVPRSRPATKSDGDRPKALLRCRRCGVHVPEALLTAGVCGSCLNENRTADG